MSKDHSKIIDDLEKAVLELNNDEFIYDFLQAYGIPKATITGLKKNTNGRNIGFDHGDIGFKNKIYFRQCEKGTNLQSELEKLKTLDAVVKGKARLLIVTDFEEIAGYDLTANELLAEIELNELHKQYAFFLPLAGYEKAVVYSDHPADVKASEKLGLLFDLILKQNHIEDDEDKRHALNVFLTRLLFCFYAEDTGIFKESQMSNAIANTTQPDGSDLDQFFATLFKVLNTPKDDAFRKTLPTHLSDFEYVNGGLFASDSFIPKFGKKSRRVILESGSLDWKKINPDIFGSMFQSVVDPKKRGSLGQHYTSVPNIMKVIQPLFLDKLYEELEKSKGNVKKLEVLIMRLERIRVFDPACGSGNFLIIAYKELRRFEMAVFKALNEASGQDVMFMSGIKLSQFYGIEIDDFAHEIALLSLWLTEHQMNVEFKGEFGYAEPTLPLRDAGNIQQGNSLGIDWEDVCPKSDDKGELEVYICGNPPFVGKKKRNDKQTSEMGDLLSDVKGYKNIDYVACWFIKSANFVKGTILQSCLVTTNSICQGEQAIFWKKVFSLGVRINIGYQTFKWSNSAKGKAGVHVMIIGLCDKSNPIQNYIFKTSKDNLLKAQATNINPYLIEGKDVVIESRNKPINHSLEMVEGVTPLDGKQKGLRFNENEYRNIVEKEPHASEYFRLWVNGDALIKRKYDYCLWITDLQWKEAQKLPEIRTKIQSVEEFRLSSEYSSQFASRSWQMRETYSPEQCIVIPKTSSENRRYIPIDFVKAQVIANSALYIEASLFEFAILTSEMHNDWMRVVSGRLKSDYRYSARLVFNNFPFPSAPDDSEKKSIEPLAKDILLIRQDYELEGLTLANMYDPDKMPEDLLAAHKALDKAVEKLYRDKPFKDVSERLEFLFARYEELIEAERKS